MENTAAKEYATLNEFVSFISLAFLYRDLGQLECKTVKDLKLLSFRILYQMKLFVFLKIDNSKEIA